MLLRKQRLVMIFCVGYASWLSSDSSSPAVITQMVATVFSFAKQEWNRQILSHGGYERLYEYLVEHDVHLVATFKPYTVYYAAHGIGDWEFDIHLAFENINQEELEAFGEEYAHLMSDVRMILLYIRAVWSELLRTQAIEHDTILESTVWSCVFNF